MYLRVTPNCLPYNNNLNMKGIILSLLFLLISAQNSNVVCEAYSDTCVMCVPSYFLDSDNNCYPCQDAIPGCLNCSTNTNCTLCRDEYDLVSLSTTTTICRACPDGTFFNNATSQCETCSVVVNCKRCIDSQTCKQCISGYYLADDKTCVVLSTPFNMSNVANSALTEQYLLALMPIFKKPVDNLQSLSRVCTNNGYSCQCVSPNLTSRCTSFPNATAINSSVQSIYSSFTALTTANIASYSLAIEYYLQNQIQTANILTKLTSNLSTLITLAPTAFNSQDRRVYRIIFEIIGKLKYNSVTYASLSNLLKTIHTSIVANYKRLPIDNGSIVYYGNQYVGKWTLFEGQGTVVSASNYTYTNLNSVYNTSIQGNDCLFMTFNRSAFDQSFTGNLFYSLVAAPASSVVNITIPYLSSLASVGNYQLTLPINSTVQNTSISLNNGSFTFSKSVTSDTNYYLSVNSTPADMTDYHRRIRIQQVFYMDAFFYFLVFILLYLIFIPLCTFYDIVKDPKSKKYKPYVIKEKGTMEDIRVTEENIPAFEHYQEDVEINYKQFFPIYNIAATPNRPQRLLKLTLYLLNLQNPTTMLVLLYSAVNADSNTVVVWSILLAIPSYFLNIILAYIYGTCKKFFKGKWKWAINVMPVVYWIIWFFVMPRITIHRVYLIIFSVVLIAIDLIVDALECCIMYFVIKEQNPFFDCIAPVLAYRGYYKHNAGE